STAAASEEEGPVFDQQAYILRKAFDADHPELSPPLVMPERIISPSGYHVNQLGNNLELVTPYGRRLIFGDFGFNNAREYRLEIPIEQLFPTGQKPPVAEKNKPVEDAARAVKEAAEAAKNAASVPRNVAQIPEHTIVEYDNTDRLFLEANRLYNRGRYYQATLTVEEILSKRPDMARGWVMKGSLLYVQGQRDLAKTAWEKSLELDPKNAQVKAFLGRLK
ncbi:tetratricopeptide repeat protein, partial [bacterium]|nr:tetratricopeptide repeat protein [bacterium]